MTDQTDDPEANHLISRRGDIYFYLLFLTYFLMEHEGNLTGGQICFDQSIRSIWSNSLQQALSKLSKSADPVAHIPSPTDDWPTGCIKT